MANPVKTPAQTASDYAIKFNLKQDDPQVTWVKNHSTQYQELVDIKNELATANKLDPDKFAVKVVEMDKYPAPNAGVKPIIQKYEKDPSKVNIIHFDPANFAQGLTRQDRKDMMAHEMGHVHNVPGVENQMQELSEALSEHFSWFKPLKDTVAEAAKDFFYKEELRADREGAVLLGCNAEEMAKNLEKLGTFKIPNGKGGFVTLEEVNENAPDHPSIKVRAATLRKDAAEIQKACPSPAK